MESLDVLRRLHEHRIWADRELVSAATKLTADQLQQVFPIGQGSVWKSLCHMWGAEFVWIEALHGIEAAIVPGDDPAILVGNQQGANGMKTLAELAPRWESLHTRWTEYLSNLSDSELSTPVWRSSPLVNPPKRLQTARVDVLLHVCLHAHWTAAQTVNIFRSLGMERLPNVMHISLARMQLGQ